MTSEGVNEKSFNPDNLVMDAPPTYDQANATAPYPVQSTEVSTNYPTQSYPTQLPPLQATYPSPTAAPMTTTTLINPYPMPMPIENMTPEQQLAYQQAQMQAQALVDEQQKRALMQRKKICLFVAVPMVIFMILAVVLGNVLPRVL